MKSLLEGAKQDHNVLSHTDTHRMIELPEEEGRLFFSSLKCRNEDETSLLIWNACYWWEHPPPQQGRPTSLHRVLNDPLNAAEDGTHTGLDRRPRLPFLPMTGVPKCSGLVRGSLSRVCTGDKDFKCRCLKKKKNKAIKSNMLYSTSLSAKWRAPFRQREERLRVFSSPSSNTADETQKLLGWRITGANESCVNMPQSHGCF